MGDIVASESNILDLLIEQTKQHQILWGYINDAYYHRFVHKYFLEMEVRLYTRDVSDRKAGSMVIEGFEMIHYVMPCAQLIVLEELIKRQKSDKVLNTLAEILTYKK